MPAAGPSAGDIQLYGDSRLHNGHQIKNAIFLDAEGAGRVEVHYHGAGFRISDIAAFAKFASRFFGFILSMGTRKRTFSFEELRPYDYEDEFDETLDRITPGTCQWILGHPSITWWITRSDYTLLWMTGSPGMGKTLLATYLVHTLKVGRMPSQHREKPWVVLYSLCNKTENNTAGKLLCIALHQLLCQVPELTDLVELSLQTRGTHLWETAPKIIWRHFCKLIEESNLDRVYLVIDGLDDCESHSHVDLFKLLRSGPPNLRVLVTSQPLELVRVEVSKSLAGKAHYQSTDLDLEEASINADIDSVIDRLVHELACLRGYSDGQKDRVSQFLKVRRSGSFLPVVLIAAQLQLAASTDIDDVLDSTSVHLEELDDLYRKLVEGVTTKVLLRPSEILKCILYTYRPLSTGELAHACGYASTSHDQEQGSQEANNRSPVDLVHDLKLLGPIVRIRHSDSTVHFFHSSARKFLEEYSIAIGSFVASPYKAHVQLAKLCIDCLLRNSQQKFPFPWENLYSQKLDTLLSRCSLLDYALDYWDQHVSEAFAEGAVPVDGNGHPRLDAEQRCLVNLIQDLADIINDSSKSSFAAYFQTYREGRFFASYYCRMTSLMLYLQLGLTTLLKQSLALEDRSCSLSLRQAYITAAVKSGDIQAFNMIVGFFGEDLDGPAWDHLLAVAARTGKPEIVRFVLQCRRSNPKVLAIAALQAAGQPTDECLEALGEDRLRIRQPDALGSNILHHIVLISTDRGEIRVDVVRRALLFFKDRGVSINETDAFGNTILHHICWSYSLCKMDLLESLFNVGADPMIRNQVGQLPLHLAARKADFESLEFLLSKTIACLDEPPSQQRLKGSDVSGDPGDSPDEAKETSKADLAIRGSREAMARDNSKFRSEGGLTPLHWAMARSCTMIEDDMRVLHALLIAGFDLAAASRTGRTPLSDARENATVMNVLCLVYYRLDGADHLQLSLSKAFWAIAHTTSVDTMWHFLDFDRHFRFMLSGEDDFYSNDLELKCIERALAAFFTLRKRLSRELMKRFEVDEVILDLATEAMKKGESLDYTNPNIVWLRQYQVMKKLCQLDNIEVIHKRSDASIANLKQLKSSVEKERFEYLFRQALEVGGSSSSSLESSQQRGMTATSTSNIQIARQTIRNVDDCFLLSEWQNFLEGACYHFLAGNNPDLVASVTCLRLRKGLKLKAKRNNFRMTRESHIEALTRLQGLLGARS